MLLLNRKFIRFRDAKATYQIPNPRLYRCAKIRIRHPYMKRRIDVKWCVINLCFGRDRLKDEVKQLLILPIVVFCVLSAYILRLSNHTHFRLLRYRLYIYRCCLVAPWWQIWEHLTRLAYSAVRSRGPRPPRYNEARLYMVWLQHDQTLIGYGFIYSVQTVALQQL